LRQGGGAARLCIGDHSSVLLRDVASLVLRDAGTPAAHSANICLDFASVPITQDGITLPLHISRSEVKKVFHTKFAALFNSSIRLFMEVT